MFTWPVTGRLVLDTCSAGKRRSGIDIAAPAGTMVTAAADGIVAYAGDHLRSHGKLVLIRHREGWATAYAYGSELLVGRGDHVRQGQPIAVVGRLAAMSFPGLHFEIRKGTVTLEPLEYLQRRLRPSRPRPAKVEPEW